MLLCYSDSTSLEVNDDTLSSKRICQAIVLFITKEYLSITDRPTQSSMPISYGKNDTIHHLPLPFFCSKNYMLSIKNKLIYNDATLTSSSSITAFILSYRFVPDMYLAIFELRLLNNQTETLKIPVNKLLALQPTGPFTTFALEASKHCALLNLSLSMTCGKYPVIISVAGRYFPLE